MEKNETESEFASELEAIHKRLTSIEESIKNLTIAVQSLTSRSNPYTLTA